MDTYRKGTYFVKYTKADVGKIYMIFDVIEDEGKTGVCPTVGCKTDDSARDMKADGEIVELLTEYLELAYFSGYIQPYVMTVGEAVDTAVKVKNGESTIVPAYEVDDSNYGILSLKMDILNLRTKVQYESLMKYLAGINENVLDNWHPAG